MGQVKIGDIHAGLPNARDDFLGNQREFKEAYEIPPKEKEREEERKKRPWTGNPETVGSIITFGRYPQEGKNAPATGIEWKVLDVKCGKSLLISQYALDVRDFNEEFEDVTWETCTLRRWLNQEFLQEAFTQEEQRYISPSTIKNLDNPEYKTKGGNDTKDKVFLLSLEEAGRYFSSDDERVCKPTQYALSQDDDIVNKSIGSGCWWWLRSPGYDSYSAADVWRDGSLHELGRGVDYISVAVRPALWVNLNS